MALRLRPLREDEFDDYVAHGTANYARDMMENAGVPPELAQTKSDSDWAQLLPKGLDSPNQHLFAIEDENGQRVGDLWFAKRTSQFEGTAAFIYSIEIAPEFRGRGYGREAMLLLEDEVRSHGLTRIGLNVFGGNEVARSLYRSLGYAESAVWMAKDLD